MRALHVVAACFFCGAPLIAALGEYAFAFVMLAPPLATLVLLWGDE